MRRRVTVVGSVCLLSQNQRLFILKILSCTQRATEVKFVGFSLFKSYSMKHKRKSQYAI